MKTVAVTLAALVLFGMSFATPSTSAASFYPESASDASSSLIQIANKKYNKKSEKKHNYTGARGYIPGHVMTPYGYADCRGWWERHSDGRMQCHGVLILKRWWD